MRTTLAIDDDILLAVKEIAVLQQKTAGEVISALARQALRLKPQEAKTRNGVPLLPIRQNSGPITHKFIKQLDEELP